MHPSSHVPHMTSEFVEKAIAGDQPSREKIIARYGARVWSVCRRVSHEAEDAYQETWKKAFAALHRFDPTGPSDLGSWLTTIAHRHLIDAHRRTRTRGVVVPFRDDLCGNEESPELSLDRRRRVQRLEHALSRLKPDHRRVVVLHHIQGLSLTHIAHTEGVAVGTIKSRLHRGRADLAHLLETT